MSLGDAVMSRLGDHSLDRALNESWPRDASTTPDRPRVRVVARVVWARAGDESIEGYAMRWSGRCVFVTPRRARCHNWTLCVWLDATHVSRLAGPPVDPRLVRE
jgi:hypothetical protein